ncbi:MAG: EAL domain-containing protein [Acidocella sp.]|nr:EAL domain-containing protein [Acidocella sp.]
MNFMHTDILAGTGLLAALLLLAGTIAAMRADSLFLRRRLEAEISTHRQWSRALADAGFDGLLIHRQGVILMMNRALVHMLGVREREWLGQNFATLAREDQQPALRAELEAPQASPVAFNLVPPNKPVITAELSSQTIAYEGQPATVTALRDITQRLADATRIARLTNYDELTGLPNRKHFTTLLAQAVAAGSQYYQQGAVTLFITDIDHFKTANEQLGRAGGDMLLQQLTQRIGALLAKEDVLARLGSDKFALLLTPDSPPNRGLLLGGQLLAACNEPFIVDGQLAKLSLSIGIGMYPDHAADAEGLMQASELALAQAARAGGGALHLFRHEDMAPKPASRSAGPRPHVVETTHLRDDLRAAMSRGEIKLLYQPILALPDLSLAGFEALARWQHPAEGLLGPERFMPIADAAGLAQELGSQLIERACAEAVAAGVPRIAVNLSQAQLRDADLPARLSAILRKTGLRPDCLEIEISDALLAEPQGSVAQVLHAVRALGIGIALDDFGTGASSLSMLCHLPLNRLKIDRSVVRQLGQDKTAEAIVNAVVTLCANLQLEVTALGVESETQLALLRQHGCHAGQGSLLGEPAVRAISRGPDIAAARA